MPDRDSQIAALEARVTELEALLMRLTEKQRREVNALMGCDEVLNTHRKVLDAELTDAFERIIKLELTVFPDLADDIADLSRTIGNCDGKAYNPLDFRGRRPKG